MRRACIEIKEEGKGQSSVISALNSASQMGLFNESSSAKNQLENLTMPYVILQTIKRLHLDYDYSVKGSFHANTIYGNTLPVKAEVLDLDDTQALSFTITLQANGKYVLSEFVKPEEEEVDYEGMTAKGQLGDTITTPIGQLVFTPTDYFEEILKSNEGSIEIQVNRIPFSSMLDIVSNRLEAQLVKKDASIIEVIYKDVNVQRAEDILSTLISVNNENWIQDKNQMAISTNEFINERLNIIEKELGNVDTDISSYKSENLITDNMAEASLYMTQSAQANNQIMDLNNQLYMLRHVRNFLQQDDNSKLVPENTGLGNSTLVSQIGEYNKLVLQRNNMLSISSENNPLVQRYDNQIIDMRNNIRLSLDNEQTMINAQINSLKGSVSRSTGKLSSTPKQEKYLLSVERQQKVKESLYLFLLQKREENELSQAFTAYNTRIVNPPMGSAKPIGPDTKKVLLIGFILGILIPVAYLYLKETSNTKVRGRKDIEDLTLPYIGEIPLYSLHHRKWWQKLLRKKRQGIGSMKERDIRIVVKPKERNIINEAFRMIRTNMSYMLSASGQDKKQLVMITSCNPGSGKSFISVNIASSLAVSGKKVLLIDLDLRRATISKIINSPKDGISNYIAGFTDTCKTYEIEGHEGISMIPVGTLPPNPAELLLNPRLKDFLNDMRNKYDYIICDCPPVELVADTNIIGQYMDATVFVIRAELLEREMLPAIQRYYNEQKYPNMSLLLNGTSSAHGRYGYHYGYRSYGYGYGSYGYGYGEEKA